jgi:hypothetical protein
MIGTYFVVCELETEAKDGVCDLTVYNVYNEVFLQPLAHTSLRERSQL